MDSHSSLLVGEELGPTVGQEQGWVGHQGPTVGLEQGPVVGEEQVWVGHQGPTVGLEQGPVVGEEQGWVGHQGPINSLRICCSKFSLKSPSTHRVQGALHNSQ